MKDSDFVSALARGIEVLRLFSKEQPQLSTSEVSEKTGLSRAAARRFLLTLVELGYLRADQDFFVPMPKLLELGYSYLSTWSMTEVVHPYLQNVVSQLRENCSMGVLDDGNVVYLARAEARRIVQSITISIGTRVPATVSAMGRVLLAWLPPEQLDTMISDNFLRPMTSRTVTDPVLFRERLTSIKAAGYALVEGEFEEGLISIAVPILTEDGRAVAAINVGTPTTRASAEQMVSDYLPVLQKAAQDISRAFSIRPRAIEDELIVKIEANI